jgi:response regulator RpfG family c-di-GMP phosphodiesterase
MADIVSLSGKRFDPELVEVFVAESERFREVAETYRD